MEIIIAVISIFTITGAVWLLNKALPFYICPICAGVSGTWLWMLGGVLTNNLQPTTYNLVIAILMGGSVVGIAYQVEKLLPPNRSALIWKILFIPIGFFAVDSLVSFQWITFAAAAGYLLIVTLAFLYFPKSHSENGKKAVGELEKKMKNCC